MPADPIDKDEPNEFGASSDYAQGQPVGRYAGGGPDDSQEPAPKPKGEQTWQAGAGGGPMRDDPNALHQAAGGDDAVRSRSADPGQSSYGGFKNEGGADATHDDLGAPRDASNVGGIATSDANLGAGLPDASRGAEAGTDRDDDTQGAPSGATDLDDASSGRLVDAEAGASEKTESPGSQADNGTRER